MNERTQAIERCPGGYFINGRRLCGRSGNRCVDRCAFEYRRLRDLVAKLDPSVDNIDPEGNEQ